MPDSVVRVIFEGVDKSLSSAAASVNDSFGRIGKGIAIGVGALAAAGAGAAVAGYKLLDLGSTAQETGSLLEASLGDSLFNFNDALRDVATTSNRSFYELQSGSSTLVAMLKGMGATGNGAADLSAGFAQMAVDLGSFFNKADSDVFADFQSALGGSSETLQKYGIDVRDTTLKAEALRRGFIADSSDVIPPLNRAMLIYDAILTQAGDAMGDAERTSGSFANQQRGLRAQFVDLATSIGSRLIPAVQPLMGALSTLAAAILPKIESAFSVVLPILESVATVIGSFVSNLSQGMTPIDAFINAISGIAPPAVRDFFVNLRDVVLPQFRDALTTVKDKIAEFTEPIAKFITDNVALKDVLIGLGIVLGGVVLSALISIAASLAPILVLVGAIIGAVALFRAIWEKDLGGIRTFLETAWANIQPVLASLWAWLQTTIPAAIATLAGFWNNTLVPAMQTVYQWFNDNILPVLQSIWQFLTVDMLPVWESLAEFFNVAIPLAIGVVQAAWENKLQPALQSAWEWIKDKVNPALEVLRGIFDKVSIAAGGVSSVIETVVGWIRDLTDKLKNIELPDWLTPGSPTPFEIGLRGIRRELRGLAAVDMPALEAASARAARTAATGGRYTTINQTTTVYTSRVSLPADSDAARRFALAGI